jgi:hypothetical protein
LLFKNLRIKIYKTIIFPVAVNGCETWLLTLRDERRLMVFENRVIRRIFGPKRDEVTREWRKLHNEEVILSVSLTQYCSGDKIEKNEGDGACSMYWRRVEEYAEFWRGTLRVRGHLEDPGIDGRIILGWILRKWDVELWTGSSWLRIGIGGGYF